MVSNKVYVVGVGMSKFIKPRGEVDYPGKGFIECGFNGVPLINNLSIIIPAE